MTTAKAARITGCGIGVVRIDNKYRAIASEGSVLIAECRDYSPSGALSRLVEAVYRILSARQREKQRGRCANCNELRPLEMDHIIPRSKGREDRQIRGLCRACHVVRHTRGHL